MKLFKPAKSHVSRKLNAWEHDVRLTWLSDRDYLELPEGVIANESLKKAAASTPIDEGLVSSLVALARIPAQNAGRLRAVLTFELAREWRFIEEASCRPGPNEREAAVSELQQLKFHSTAIKKILTSATPETKQRLKEAALSLYMRTASFWDVITLPIPDNVNRIDDTLETITWLSQTSGYALPSQVQGPSRPRRAGRPRLSDPVGPGSSKQFVLRLLWDVKDLGGRLTHNKDDGSRSHLAEALSLLSPHFPPTLVRKSFSRSTLANWKALAERMAETDADDR